MNIQDRAALVLQQIDAALAMAEKATAEPWEYDGKSYIIGNVQMMLRKDNVGITHADATFIAASRTGWPTALRCLKEDIQWLLEVLAMPTAPIHPMIDARLTALCELWEASR